MCQPPTAEAILDAGDVRALIPNTGTLFYNDDRTLYEVPKGSGLQSHYAAGFAMGGEASGEVRFAGSWYDRHDFWPGPLGADGQPDADLCAAYDRIWTVSVSDIAAYNATGTATDDLAEWPYEAGAPVVDGDGIADNYDLAAGDRPAILGQSTAWWVMNDLGGAHRGFNGSTPIGIEVRVTAFSFSAPYASDRYGDIATGEAASAATFFRYEVTYRGDDALDHVRLGVFSDPDLGYFSDDYLGGDPDRAMGYVYNGDDDDEGTTGYGSTPPAHGIRLLGVGSDDICVTQILGSSSVATGMPATGEEAYMRLGCLWRDGSPQTTGGTGLGPGDPAPVLYPAGPPAYWSEADVDGSGTSNIPSDRRLVIGREIGALQPGASVTFDAVLPWARSSQSRYESVRDLRTASDLVAALPFTPDPRLRTLLPDDIPTGTGDAPSEANAPSLAVWPNPASGAATLRVHLAAPGRATVRVVDLLGREVARLHDGTLGAGETHLSLPASTLPPGAYVARVITPEAEASRRFVVAR